MHEPEITSGNFVDTLVYSLIIEVHTAPWWIFLHHSLLVYIHHYWHLNPTPLTCQHFLASINNEIFLQEQTFGNFVKVKACYLRAWFFFLKKIEVLLTLIYLIALVCSLGSNNGKKIQKYLNINCYRSVSIKHQGSPFF